MLSSSSSSGSGRPQASIPAVAAAAAAAASGSGSRAVTGSIGRPAAASAVYGGEQPAPTVGDIWSDPDASAIIDEFRLFFEDPRVQKVWHNYGFDRHVLQRLGFRMRGFGGDTLHMARLWDASRKGSETYALDSLSRDSKVRQCMGVCKNVESGVCVSMCTSHYSRPDTWAYMYIHGMGLE
jgi:hypothetical protein